MELDEEKKTASVVVPERMLSLAIGKEGQNARLAAKLTGWRIDIRSAVAADAEEDGVIDDDELARRAVPLLRAEAAASGAPSNGFEPPNHRDPTRHRRKSAARCAPTTQ